ncbi:MAG: hypothetical protein J7463_07685 [Roseiflexus sp.]|nr:hypothetical protein [Roseiflexus sp.]MBO9341554.1 hypothetical protein [Roseiflexus sp.]MBO9384750.1 hypothetical protein [Roseiflexus sp.]MBO9391249.1 hypothetical protein [Roseiflexus sp.]
MRNWLFRFGDNLIVQLTASIPATNGSWAATKAAYRLLDAQSVTPEAIRAAHQHAARTRIAAQSTTLVRLFRSHRTGCY